MPYGPVFHGQIDVTVRYLMGAMYLSLNHSSTIASFLDADPSEDDGYREIELTPSQVPL
jgi:hypothetical protein